MRRAFASGVLAAAALIPPAVWLAPALLQKRAPSFRDQADFFFPLKLYTADRLRAGRIPLWNPLSGCGEPWLANAQSGVFYPPTFLFLLPVPALAAGLFLFLHFGVAVWGTWRFCKEEGVTDAGALAGALVFAGSGAAASLSAYWNHFGAFAYLPGILALARSGLRTRGAVAGMTALVGLQAMAGSPELSAITILLAAVFAFARREETATGWRETTAAQSRRRAAGAILAGLALAAWVLVPLGELAMRSERRTAFPAAEREVGALHPGAAAAALGAPDDWAGSFFLASVYLGPVALGACAAALADRERRRLVGILAAIALAGILLASAGPPGAWIRALPGLDRIRYPAKALAATLFAAAVLTGLGFDALRFLPARRVRGILAAVCLALGAAALAWSGRPMPVRAAAAAGAGALALLALARASRPSVGAVFAAAAAFALVTSYALGNLPLFRFVPEEEIRKRPDSIEFLAKLPGRALTPPMPALAPWVSRDWSFDAAMVRRQRETLIGYTNLLEGVRTLRSAAALPTEGARRIADAVDAAPDPSLPAGLASGRVLWSPFLPGKLGSRKVGDFFRAPLNPYRPRLSFTSVYSVETDAGRAWARAASAEGDEGRRVFLSREPSPRPEAGGGKYVVAGISAEEPERIAADVSADRAGLLVLTDLAYPGWTARLDGAPAEILLADGSFRAVAVPAGTHHVEFRYRPISVYAGAAISAAALLGLLVWWRRAESPGGAA
ncbi:MAG TPA: hypothetical protein VMQ61_05515 [Thermoanaerobaculia bacterium]|nr:hypothetical protein [Thermoanaerobaculia bacterium]